MNNTMNDRRMFKRELFDLDHDHFMMDKADAEAMRAWRARREDLRARIKAWEKSNPKKAKIRL